MVSSVLQPVKQSIAIVPAASAVLMAADTAEAVTRRKRLPLPLIDQPMEAAGTEAVAMVVAAGTVAMVADTVVATADLEVAMAEVIARLEGTNVVPVCQAN